MVKDRLDHRDLQERQEPPVLRDRLGAVGLEAEHLNDLRRVITILSTIREEAVAPMTGHEAHDEVHTTITTIP